ncbi:hypothetical protein EVAR_52689_1 [Eumeta japonica]|uniref:Uncharacterized protein n=1 Tax=Eumeta variegata TaxID=151549 RepID=A0A4C1Y4F5_EUMVA|nr:hypothetical protein EVAR_52689_1 [Eumeta japonica]
MVFALPSSEKVLSSTASYKSTFSNLSQIEQLDPFLGICTKPLVQADMAAFGFLADGKYLSKEIDASQVERLGRSCLSIARSALSLAHSAQAERDNESCFFIPDTQEHDYGAKRRAAIKRLGYRCTLTGAIGIRIRWSSLRRVDFKQHPPRLPSAENEEVVSQILHAR